MSLWEYLSFINLHDGFLIKALLLLVSLLFVVTTSAYDWDYEDYDDCSIYVESYDDTTDFMIKCYNDEGELDYLEDYIKGFE